MSRNPPPFLMLGQGFVGGHDPGLHPALAGRGAEPDDHIVRRVQNLTVLHGVRLAVVDAGIQIAEAHGHLVALAEVPGLGDRHPYSEGARLRLRHGLGVDDRRAVGAGSPAQRRREHRDRIRRQRTGGRTEPDEDGAGGNSHGGEFAKRAVRESHTHFVVPNRPFVSRRYGHDSASEDQLPQQIRRMNNLIPRSSGRPGKPGIS
ncbi:hypothetical protein ACWGMO_06360 [Nocardia salmonicida]